MAEKRSLFGRLFGSKPFVPKNTTMLQMLNGYTPFFTDFGNNAYDSDVVRSAVDAIARNAAKLKGKHIRKVEGQVFNTSSAVDYLLSVRPNEYMDSYTFMYRVVTNLYMKNNAFIYIEYDKMGSVKGFYPLNSSTVEFIENQKEIFCKFRFMGSDTLVVPYSQIIHLRRFFYKNDLYGEITDNALLPALDLLTTTNQGISNAVKTSAYLRGMLKFQSMLKPEDMKRQRDLFVTDYMDLTNNGGIAATDAKADYQELKSDPKMIDAKQMEMIEDKVYKYYGISPAIIKSNYTEDEWNSFYSSVIEPFALQLSLEMTAKIFTDRERGFGNEIVYSASRLTYASNATKVSMARELMPLGIFTVNEIREIFELEPVENGDKRYQTLNVVNANTADQYQTGGATDGSAQPAQQQEGQGVPKV